MSPTSPSRTISRVLVVGPWRSPTSTGCCTGDPEAILGRPTHSHPAPERVAAADLVRRLRTRVRQEVDIQLVDPRNTVFIAAAIWRDARYSDLSVVDATRQIVRATTPDSVVIAGVVRWRGRLPCADDVVGQMPRSWLA